MAENMKLLNAFSGEQRQHILSDSLRLIAIVGFAAVGVPAQVRRDETCSGLTSPSITGRNSRWFCGQPCMHSTTGPVPMLM